MGRATTPAAGTHRYAGARRSASVWWHRRVTWARAVWRWASRRAWIAHLARAVERFSDRVGNQFAASITYFSFLSLIPMVMVGFSVAGFVLASRPDLLDALKDQVIALVPGGQSGGQSGNQLGLREQVGTIIDDAVKQRLSVGIIGLVVAMYSGLRWIGNVRDAVQAMWRPHWIRAKVARQTYLADRLSDLISLLGLLIAVVITFSLTAVGTAAKDLVLDWLGLADVAWVSTVMGVGPFVVAICGDVLIFAWAYTIMPYKGYRADRRTLLIGSLTMAVCFEVLKAALTILVTQTSSSPSVRVFGSVIGLLLFFNLVARAFLMVAAWIGTGSALTEDQEARPAIAPEVTVVLREPWPGRRTHTAFGIGAVLGWIYGRNRRR